MTKTTKTLIAAAAVTGLLTGSAARLHAGSSDNSNTASLEKAGIRLDDTDKGKHDCKGHNDCKGQGGCQSGDNGCKGKNSCKGKGGCNTNKPH